MSLDPHVDAMHAWTTCRAGGRPRRGRRAAPAPALADALVRLAYPENVVEPPASGSGPMSPSCARAPAHPYSEGPPVRPLPPQPFCSSSARVPARAIAFPRQAAGRPSARRARVNAFASAAFVRAGVRERTDPHGSCARLSRAGHGFPRTSVVARRTGFKYNERRSLPQ